MPDDPADAPNTGPIDAELLDRIAAHRTRSARFNDIQARPAYAPDSAVGDYDLGCFPGGVTRAYLRIRWFETDDFNIHYAEQYQTRESWECRCERYPNDHNAREHFHLPPDAPKQANAAIRTGETMRVTGNTIYEHDEHGTVLVLDVHHVFDEYDLETGSGELHSRVVRYTPNWDGYGPMPGSIKVTSTDDFREQLGDQVGTFEPLEPQAETDE